MDSFEMWCWRRNLGIPKRQIRGFLNKSNDGMFKTVVTISASRGHKKPGRGIARISHSLLLQPCKRFIDMHDRTSNVLTLYGHDNNSLQTQTYHPVYIASKC